MQRIASLLCASTFALYASLAGCTKPPSPAYLAYQSFADNMAKADLKAARAQALEGVEFAVTDTGSGSLADGRVRHLPMYDTGIVGKVWWTKYKLESETKGSGTADIVATQDACRQPDDARSACMRPTVSRHHVQMKDDGAGWKVAAFSEELVTTPR